MACRTTPSTPSGRPGRRHLARRSRRPRPGGDGPRRCRSSTSQTAFSVRSTRRFTAAGSSRRIGGVRLRARPAEGGAPASLVPVTGIRNQCWWFASCHGRPRRTAPTDAAGRMHRRLYRIRGDGSSASMLAPGDGTLRAASLAALEDRPDALWVGLFDGLASFRWVNGRWMDEGRVPDVRAEVRVLLERPGRLPLGRYQQLGPAARALRISASARWPSPGRDRRSLRRRARLERRRRGAGRCRRRGVFRAVVGASPEYYVARFDAATRTFVRDPFFDQLPTNRLAGSFGLAWIGGRLFVNRGKGTAVLARTGDTWSIDTATFSRFGQVPWGFPGRRRQRRGLVQLACSATSSATTCTAALACRRPPTRRSCAASPPVMPTWCSPAPALQRRRRCRPRRPRCDSSTRRRRSSMRNATEFQTRLDGLDRDWTPWSGETRRDFTNLGFGDFRFHVRARNIAGTVSDEATYALTILPPWYRTWSAYAGLSAARRRPGPGRRSLAAPPRCSARSANGRSSPKRGCGPKPPRRWRAPRARARSRSSCSAASAARSPRRSTSTRSSASSTSASTSSPTPTSSASVSTIPSGRRSSTGWRSRRASATRRTRATPATPTSCRCGASSTASRCSSTTSPSITQKYVSRYEEKSQRLEDGSMSKTPQSLIYLPLEPRTGCSASSPSRASRRTPTPTIT